MTTGPLRMTAPETRRERVNGDLQSSLRALWIALLPGSERIASPSFEKKPLLLLVTHPHPPPLHAHPRARADTHPTILNNSAWVFDGSH